MVKSRSSGSSSTNRISTGSLSIISSFQESRWFQAGLFQLLLACRLQSEIECGAFIQFRFGPDPAAVLVNDPLHCGQPDAGAFEVLPAVQTLEDPEQFVDVLHAEPDPVVSHEQHRLS